MFDIFVLEDQYDIDCYKNAVEKELYFSYCDFLTD
jgi:hypothetical protein